MPFRRSASAQQLKSRLLGYHPYRTLHKGQSVESAISVCTQISFSGHEKCIYYCKLRKEHKKRAGMEARYHVAERPPCLQSNQLHLVSRGSLKTELPENQGDEYLWVRYQGIIQEETLGMSLKFK